ncbi:MAG TPA: hypothetical protein VK542_00090 [Gemmatimonadaceae bacterium]|nr:hypothetical protein [Gemmatimonadaceae bacterium]
MRRHVAVTAVVALLVVACNGENTPIPDRGPPRALPPNNGREPLKGALPKPIGEITASEFQAVIDGIGSWVGGTTTDRCTDAPLCGLGFSKVPVSIQPAFDAANANPNNVGIKGTILLQLKNLGDKNAGGLSRYKLKKHETYYVVVKSLGNGQAGWEIVHFEDNHGEPPKPSGDSGSFHSCQHNPATSSMAAFYSCDNSPNRGASRIASSSKKASMVDLGMLGALMHFNAFSLTFLEQAPGWVSCAFGCCTLEMS